MEEENYDNRVDLKALTDTIKKLKSEIGKVIIGQEKAVDLIVTSILANGHVLIEGVPGVAKTLLTKLIAKLIKVDFSRIQFTPDLMPSDILGTSVFNMQTSSFEFIKGPIFSQIVLIDEINRSPAKTQAALFEVMEERQITMDGNRYEMEEPFMILATQNPIEQEGTYRLPEAQLDRFIFKITMGYPSMDQEIKMLTEQNKQTSKQLLQNAKPVLSKADILSFRDKVQRIHVEVPIFEYLAKITGETRENKNIYLGASPRATVHLLNASKAFAAMQGRDFVTPDDILFVAVPVLSHRILLTPEKEMEGGTTTEVLKEILDKVEIPR